MMPTTTDTASAGHAPKSVASPKRLTEIIPRGTRRTVAAAGTTSVPIAMMGKAATSRSTPAQAVATSSWLGRRTVT